MYVTAGAFGLMGLVLFAAPAWSAANFPWKISPMVAMTMGGWYLGSAAIAALIAYYCRWPLIYACALYVMMFAASQAAVMIVHAPLVRLSALLAWPYLGMLAIAVASGLVLLVEWVRKCPALTDEGNLVSRRMCGAEGGWER